MGFVRVKVNGQPPAATPLECVLRGLSWLGRLQGAKIPGDIWHG